MSTDYRPFTYDHYRHIIQSALEIGYRFISYTELAESRQGMTSVCLLRHDCDNDMTAAAKMARLEADLKVRSTYFLMLRSALYNLMSLPNAQSLITVRSARTKLISFYLCAKRTRALFL